MQTAPLLPVPSPGGALPFTTGLLDGTPYRATRPLGKGGMGEVFEAEHVALGKRVVVKLLRLELCGDRSLVERLRVEAQSMARLDHPGIAAVHDMGVTAGGRPYFVLDYLSGEPLSRQIKLQGPLPVREAVRIALEVLDALVVAHEAGLVHRDIKPANVFLCDPDRRGRRAVKLLDFGVVKVQSGAIERSFPTEQGQFVGSPATASPEQARGEAVDGRSDLYAVGLLLYMMIAGKSPFPGATAHRSALAAHVFDVPPPLSRMAPSPVPPLLDLAVAQALAKRPEDRYSSARIMATVLERVLSRLPADAPEVGASSVPGSTGTGEERTQLGTVRLRPGSGASSCKPAHLARADLDSITVPEVRAWRARWLTARLSSAFRRVPLAPVVAVGSSVLFFVLLCLAWSILRGDR